VDVALNRARKLKMELRFHQIIGARQRLAKRLRSPTREEIEGRFRSLDEREATAEIEVRDEPGGANRSAKASLAIERAYLKDLYPSTAALTTEAERASLRKRLIALDEEIKKRPELSKLAAAQGIKLGEFKPAERSRSRTGRER
jgi:hypothetical protein